MLDEEMPEGAYLSDENEEKLDEDAAKLNIDLTGVWDQPRPQTKSKKKKKTKKATKQVNSSDEDTTTENTAKIEQATQPKAWFLIFVTPLKSKISNIFCRIFNFIFVRQRTSEKLISGETKLATNVDLDLTFERVQCFDRKLQLMMLITNKHKSRKISEIEVTNLKENVSYKRYFIL